MTVSAKIATRQADIAQMPAVAVNNGSVTLAQSRHILLSLSPHDVASLSRDGNDLLVQTSDGQVIRIENFYGSEEAASQLYLTGDDQELVWVDLSPAGGDGVIAADYIPQGEFGVFEPVSVAGGESEGAAVTPLGWAAIGGGALAAGAIAAGGGSSGGSDDDDGGNTPPDDGENGEGDTTPPDAPTITAAMDDAAPQTGDLASGDSTNDTTPRLTGRAEAGSTVTIFANGEQTGTTTADDQGNWAFTPGDLDDGDYTFSVTATDAVGNVSNGSDDYALTIDTSAPDSPTLDPNNGSVLIGTAEPGSKVTLTDGDGNAIGQTTTDDNGNWSLQPGEPLVDGTEIEAIATDAAGNVSEPGSVIVDGDLNDTTPPATPTISGVSDDVDPQTGPVDREASTNDTTPTLSGRAEAGSALTVYADGEEIGTATVNGQGEWTFTTDDLDDGDYAFTVTATDSAGNVSDASDPFTLIVDTQPPAAPAVDPTNGEILTGSAEPDSTVTLTDSDGDTIAEITADRNGNWSYAPETPLEDGAVFTATATDAAGNISEPGTATVDEDLVDALPPSEPIIITSLDTAAPVTGNVDDGEMTNDPTPTLVGTAEATNTVQVWADDGNEMQILGTTQVDNVGNWSFRIFSRLADGNTTFMATSIDPTGQESDASQPYAVVIDTTPPDAPTIATAIDDVDPVAGDLATGSDTNDNRPALRGNAESGSTVTILANGSAIGTAIADEQGDWAFTPEDALSDGDYRFTATATDAAGNESNASDQFDLTVDTVAPDIPTIEPTNGDTLTGTAEPGSTVTLTDGDDTVIAEDIPVNTDGTWSFTPDDPLVDGNTVNAIATDDAGNDSPSAMTTVDDNPPANDDGSNSILIESGGDDFLSADEASSITLSGRVEDDATVTGLTIIDGAGGSIEVTEFDIDADGNLTATGVDLSGLADGDLTATLTVEDAAGNSGTVTDTATLDQAAPTVAIDALDEPINDTTPAITGTVDDPDATVSVSVNGGEPITADVDADGNWTLPEGSVIFDEGDNTLSVTATDAAGNSATPVSDTISVDTTAPDAGDNSVNFAEDVYNADEANTATLTGQIEDGASIESLTITSAGGGDLLTIAGGGITLNGDGTFSYTADLTGLPDGDLTATLAVEDAAGNSGTVIDTATLDQTAPVVTIEALDEPINDTSPALTGTVDDSDATVSVSVNGGEPITADVDADGNWNVPTDSVTLSEGDNTIEVTATDAAGNPATPVTDTISVDITAPNVGDNSVTFADDVYNAAEANTATLTGQIESGASIASLEISSDAGDEPMTIDVDTITLNSDGSFSYTTNLFGLPDGELTVTMTVEDAAGNSAEFTDSATLDTLAPDAPTIDPTNGDTITGTAEAGSTVTLTDADGDVVGEPVLVGDDGIWSVTPDIPLADGDEVTATTTDPAGNVSDPAIETVDTIADADPTATLVINDDDGLINSDEAGAVSFTVTGLDEGVSGEVTFTDVNGNSAIADVAADGTFTINLGALADGEVISSLTITDAAGNTATVSGDTLTLDTVAPDAPTIDPANGDTITGTAEAGSTVTLTDADGDVVGEPILVGDDGIWSVTPNTPLADGDSVNAVATDPAGNVSEPATETVDGIPPAEGDNSVTIVSGDDELLSADEAGNVILTGQVEDGASIASLVITSANGGGPLEIDPATVSIAADGSFSLDSIDVTDLNDGELTVTLTVEDAVGNSAEFTDSATLDTVAPDTPVIDPTDGDTISGTAEAGSTVTVTDGDGNTIGEPVIVGDDGTWTVTPDTPLADGDEVTATATDPAGNASEPATETVDAVPPAVGDNNVTFADNVYNADEVGNVTLTGQVEDGASITSLVITSTNGGVPLEIDPATVTIAADGSFSLDDVDVTGLNDGELTATLTVEDAAGNSAEFTDSATLDTVAPDAPTIDPTDGDDITGTAEVGSTVTVTDADGNAIGEPVTVGDDGTWTVTPETPLADGDTVTATATDPAGNASDPATETVDALPPAEGDNSVTIVSGDDELLSLDEAGNVTLTGQIEDGASIASLVISDGDGGSVTVDPATVTIAADGSFSLDDVDVTGLNDGELTATLTVEDAAGNSAEFTDSATLDTVAPDAPTIDPTNGDDITGTAEVGSTVTLTDADGDVVGEPVLVGDDGTWSVTPNTPLADGDEVTATATDPAGNASEPATETVDTVADADPTASLVINDDDGLINADEAGAVSFTVEDLDTDATGEVTFTDVNGNSASADVADDGTFTLNLGALADGEITSSLTITDAAGNTTTISGDTLTLDTVAPDAPTVDPTDGDTISGTGENGSTVTVTDGNGNTIGEPVIVGDDGTWSVTPDTPLADGDTIDVVATDPAGNASDPVTAIVDAVPPADGDNGV
ncbi:Ig-like domain-containing protein, partial [Chromohalobacter sarecensis]